MKVSEIRSKSANELNDTLLELRKEQFNYRMQQGTGQLAKPSLMKQVRKDIARVKTVLNESKGGE